MYYSHKDKILKAKDSSGRVEVVSSSKDNVNERKKSNNEIDFFCEKQVQASKEDFLIEVEFNKKPT
jgi:hypothetical protein